MTLRSYGQQLLDLCVSSLRRGHANLLCIVPILTDDPPYLSLSLLLSLLLLLLLLIITIIIIVVYYYYCSSYGQQLPKLFCPWDGKRLVTIIIISNLGFPTKSPRVELSGRLPIELYGHESSTCIL